MDRSKDEPGDIPNAEQQKLRRIIGRADDLIAQASRCALASAWWAQQARLAGTSKIAIRDSLRLPRSVLSAVWR